MVGAADGQHLSWCTPSTEDNSQRTTPSGHGDDPETPKGQHPSRIIDELAEKYGCVEISAGSGVDPEPERVSKTTSEEGRAGLMPLALRDAEAHFNQGWSGFIARVADAFVLHTHATCDMTYSSMCVSSFSMIASSGAHRRASKQPKQNKKPGAADMEKVTRRKEHCIALS
jgi:hypothetical protein